jgi:hypothetical protein
MAIIVMVVVVNGDGLNNDDDGTVQDKFINEVVKVVLKLW